jgi:hypothetical protein
MNLGADIGPLAACHALGHGSLGRVGPSEMPVVVVVTTESQRDQPVGPARGAENQAAHVGTRMNLSSARKETVCVYRPARSASPLPP